MTVTINSRAFQGMTGVVEGKKKLRGRWVYMVRIAALHNQVFYIRVGDTQEVK